MLRFTRILLVSLTSGIAALLVLPGCSTNRAPSLRMLDTRAAYNSPYDDEEVALYQRSRAQRNSLGRSVGPRIAKVYMYPHELPTQDYFWGGYISLVVRRDDVIFDHPDELDAEEVSRTDSIKTTKAAPGRKLIPTKPVRVK